MKLLFFLSILTLHLQAIEYLEIEDQSDLKILSHDLKNRKIGKIELENGLQAYIVSDPNIDESAASLAVGSGSWNDPQNAPGMAHLLEHMLFMGTDKYPGERDFSKFLSDHAGKSNAYTAPHKTVYMFSVSNDAFFQTLDRFAHFFIDPLLLKDSMSRELHNVDQEHAKNIENDNWRQYMIMKETGNSRHPNRGFSTGNTKTLSPITEKMMRAWFESNYTPSNMRLVIYSPLPLEKLKEEIARIFSYLPDRKPLDFVITEPLLSPKQVGHMIYIEPVKEREVLTLTFELDPKYATDDSHSTDLVAFALKRDHENSLSELLKEKGLIHHFSIYPEKLGPYHQMLEVKFILTEEGLEKKDEVIQAFFESVNLLKEQGLPPYLYHEMTTMRTLNYAYQSREDAFNFVSEYAAKLLDEDIQTFPRKTLLPTQYRPHLIHNILMNLTPQNASYTIRAKSEKSKVKPIQQEKWLGGKYTVLKIGSDKINQYATSSLPVKIAPPNPFIPTNLGQIPLTGESEVITLIDDDHGKVLILQDDEYLNPEVAHTIHLYSPMISKDVTSKTYLSLLISYLKRTLSPTLSQAKFAGLDIDFGTHQNALSLEVSGFSEKASLLLEEVLGQLSKELNPSDFEQIKALHLQAYKSATRDLPVYQAIDLTKSLISDTHPTKEQKLRALKTITFEDFSFFHKHLFRKTYIEAFLTGNLDKKEGESIWLDIRHILGSDPYPLSEHYTPKALNMPNASGPYFIKKQTEAMGNSAILVIDEGSFTFEKRAAQSIVSKALHEAFFHELRTKQKTAYIAASQDREIEKELFQYFIVQSNTHDPLDLVYRFELFLEDFLQNLKQNIDPIRFENIKLSLKTKLSKPYQNLEEKSAFYHMLAFQYKDLKFKDKRIDALNKLSYDEFLKLAHRFLSRDNRKRLAILYSGKIPEEHFFSYDEVDENALHEVATYQ